MTITTEITTFDQLEPGDIFFDAEAENEDGTNELVWQVAAIHVPAEGDRTWTWVKATLVFLHQEHEFFFQTETDSWVGWWQVERMIFDDAPAPITPNKNATITQVKEGIPNLHRLQMMDDNALSQMIAMIRHDLTTIMRRAEGREAGLFTDAEREALVTALLALPTTAELHTEGFTGQEMATALDTARDALAPVSLSDQTAGFTESALRAQVETLVERNRQLKAMIELARAEMTVAQARLPEEGSNDAFTHIERALQALTD